MKFENLKLFLETNVADEELLRLFTSNVIDAANQHEARQIAAQYKAVLEEPDSDYHYLAKPYEVVMRQAVGYWKVNKKAPTKEWLLDKMEVAKQKFL